MQCVSCQPSCWPDSAQALCHHHHSATSNSAAAQQLVLRKGISIKIGYLQFGKCVCTPKKGTDLQPILLIGVSIVAIEHVLAAHLCKVSKEDGWSGNATNIGRTVTPTLTLSFSCVSRTVLPSAFFLQLWPSLRKNRRVFLLNKKRLPPATLKQEAALGRMYKCAEIRC